MFNVILFIVKELNLLFVFVMLSFFELLFWMFIDVKGLSWVVFVILWLIDIICWSVWRFRFVLRVLLVYLVFVVLLVIVIILVLWDDLSWIGRFNVWFRER